MLVRVLTVLVALTGSAAANVCDSPTSEDAQASCLAKCEAKDHDTCGRLGLFWVVSDASKAARGIGLLEKACRAKSAYGCGALGSVLMLGKHVTRDVKRAVTLLETGCKGNDGLSCESLGGWYAQGEGATANIDLDAAVVKAAPYYERACTLKRPAPCAFLAAFITGGNKFPNNDKKRVPGLYEAACTGGVNVACKFLGDVYNKGELVKRDIKKANTLYDKACKLGYDRGCTAKAE
jgi:TPR repeat protein